MNPVGIAQSIEQLRATLAGLGGIYQPVLVGASVVLLAFALFPQLARWRGWALTGMAALLVLGEGMLIWFHVQLNQLCVVIDPERGVQVARVAVPLWVESEKLFVWALLTALLGAFIRRQRKELLPGVMVAVAVLSAAAALVGKPFSEPLPGFLGQYMGYLQAMNAGGQYAIGAFQGMQGATQYYYNAWFMWVHPPLLFLSYACFVISFVATLLMLKNRHSSYESTAYRWARLGYLPLTFGMLLGFPWALSAWQGESWWWSGKVNMSLMMWLLYTAYLHARLYLRRKDMWKAVAALSVLSFAILVLTYLTTYVVPGAHSYALSGAPTQFAALVLSAIGGS